MRLDRALGDHKFMEFLVESAVKHLPLTESDHCAILVEVRRSEVSTGRRRKRKKRPFRYENMWQRHDDYGSFIQQAWDPGLGAADLGSVAATLSSMQSSLEVWDKEVFGSVKKKFFFTKTRA